MVSANSQPKIYQNRNFIGKDGLVHSLFIGDQNATTVKKTQNDLDTLVNKLNNLKKPILILADITKIGKVPLSARASGLVLMRDLSFDRCAIFGNYYLFKAIVDTIVLATGKSFKVKLFSNEHQAREWLIVPK